MEELIRKLVETYGPSGAEEKIRAVIQAEVEPLADEVRVDPLGNLIALKKGTGGGKRVALVAHMDEIGVMVTYVDEKGFARFASIGGVSPFTCVSGRVLFENGTVGVIGLEEKREDRSKAPKLDQLFIDTGATDRENCPIQVGDAASFWRPLVAQGSRYIAKALDDRIGCAILIETLRRLGPTPHDIYFTFSVQEEIGLYGARTSAYGINPDLAIAVDVTDTGDTPECHPMAVELGKGPAIKVKDSKMIAHPMVKALMIESAKEADIPYQLEILNAGTTDASVIQITRAGVPSGCLSVPCRHIHSPSEMVDGNDVENSVRLLLEVCRRYGATG